MVWGEYEAFCAREDVKAWLDPAATFDASTPLPVGGQVLVGSAEYRDRRGRARGDRARKAESIEVFRRRNFYFTCSGSD